MPNRVTYVGATTALLVFAVTANAAVFNIGDGDVGGLRSAIATANTNNQDDTINLAVNGGYYIPDVNNTTGGANGLPVIDRDASSGTGHSLTISGNGATVARSFSNGTAQFRIFYISNGVFANQHTTTISNVTLTNAVANGSNAGESDGGAIYVAQGQLTLNNCVLSANRATQRGGAIFVGTNTANLTLNNCTLSSNDGHFDGGGIENFAANTTLNNCTLNGNTTVVGPGGAIENLSGSGSPQTLTLTNCTLSGNSCAHSNSGAIFNATFTGAGSSGVDLIISNCTFNGNGIINSYVYTGGIPTHARVTLSNTLLSNSPLENDFQPGTTTTTITSNGYNLSSDNGGGFLTNTGDQINIDPKLDPTGLKNNGGATATIALFNGSPALDKGKNFGVTTDQRGQTRPFDLASVPNASGGDGSDIGAYESYDAIQNGTVFDVNTIADHDDGVCGALDCTLREAIAATNAASGANVINILVTGTITLGSGQLVVSDATTINGPGARLLAVSGNNTSRVFNFSVGPSVLSGLTIRNGFVTGSGIFSTGSGGGLSNIGTLTINDCTFTSNQALGGAGSNDGSGGGTALGGAVYNLFGGVLTFNRCTFASNPATGGPGGANSGSGTFGGPGGTAQGGAIYNDSGCTVTLENCTFSGNSAIGGAGGNDPSFGGGIGGLAQGAGIYNRGTMTANSCTLSGNSGTGGVGGTGNNPINNGAPGSGSGGLTSGGGTSTVRNTLSAGNTGTNGGGPDVDGTFSSGGYNLIGNGFSSTGFTATGDQVGTSGSPIDPKLASLADNGGPTQTIALLSNSPAINAGNDANAPPRDQRSYARSGLSDIGAFEYQGSLTPLTAVSRKTHGTTAFDLNLPLTGATVGVECRRNTSADGSGPNAGHDHQVIVTFPYPVSIDSASGDYSVTADALPTGFNQVYTLNLHNVPNAQLITLSLNNVRDNTNAFTDTIPMGVLLGDVNGDSFVLSGDYTAVRQKSGATVSGTNFQYDINADGFILSGDYTTVRQLSGSHLSANPESSGILQPRNR